MKTKITFVFILTVIFALLVALLTTVTGSAAPDWSAPYISGYSCYFAGNQNKMTARVAVTWDEPPELYLDPHFNGFLEIDGELIQLRWLDPTNHVLIGEIESRLFMYHTITDGFVLTWDGGWLGVLDDLPIEFQCKPSMYLPVVLHGVEE